MNEEYRAAGDTLILFLDSEHPCPGLQEATPSLKTQKTLGPQNNISQRQFIDATKHPECQALEKNLDPTWFTWNHGGGVKAVLSQWTKASYIIIFLANMWKDLITPLPLPLRLRDLYREWGRKVLRARVRDDFKEIQQGRGTQRLTICTGSDQTKSH